MNQKKHFRFSSRFSSIRPWLINFIKYVERQPPWFFIVIGLLLILIISVIDYLTGVDISLSIFYLVPIVFVTWFVNKCAGYFYSFLSTTLWFISDNIAKVYLHFLVSYWNAGVRLVIFMIITWLLAALKEAYEREKQLARTDALTEIWNRRFFLELLQAETLRARRYKHPLTLAYIDVDNFKMVNDHLGHSSGDKLLYIIAETIQNHVRATDIIARIGGDEFVLLLPETGYEGAQAIVQRVRQKLLALEAVQTQFSFVGFSIGIVTFIHLPNSIETILEQADNLMYAIKKSGKNRLEHQLFTQPFLANDD